MLVFGGVSENLEGDARKSDVSSYLDMCFFGSFGKKVRTSGL